MTDRLRRYQAPGGALAVLYKGRLVLARGYGLADRDTGEPVQPDSLFRIASISKVRDLLSGLAASPQAG